ncbi:MAG: TRAP transporter large permease subunit [Lachnospiraceae bacterium]|nr:TRAP transporter large permease subunit [Lachnospiraceae bacterium]
MGDKQIVIAVFILMYIVMIFFSKFRVHAALGAALILVITGVMPFSKIPSAINWNVLMMIAGTMVVVFYFIESGMPSRIADSLMEKSPNVMWLVILISLFSGIVSAFIDNVATVLMIAPVGLAICKKLRIDPVPVIISIAVSSNLQGAATLVGDTTSILLGGYAGMNFLDFFWMEGRPGMFFTVELGALATVFVMFLLFRKYREKVEVTEKTEVKDLVPSILLLLIVLLLIAVSFIPDRPEMINGIICMSIAVITLLQDFLRHRDREKLVRAAKDIDYQTLLLLLGIFIVVQSLTETGLIDDMAYGIIKAGGGNLFLLYTILVWASVGISAFVDNIPYVATMLPVVRSIALSMGFSPYLLYFGLLTGATLGGNLTPVGASANITAIGILKKEGCEVAFKDFARIGIPFTLTAVFVGYVFVWFVWR